MTMIKETCGNCRFSRRDDRNDNATLMCCRFPPQVSHNSAGYLTGGWPQTPKEGWCGEWFEKEPTP